MFEGFEKPQLAWIILGELQSQFPAVIAACVKRGPETV